jgi:hypothetical protein
MGSDDGRAAKPLDDPRAVSSASNEPANPIRHASEKAEQRMARRVEARNSHTLGET